MSTSPPTLAVGSPSFAIFSLRWFAMPVEYREARLEDAEPVARLLLELGYDGDPLVVRRRVERIIALSDQVVFVAIERPHGVVGMIHADVQITLLRPPWAEVCTLVVTAAQRKGGIGRGLIERVQGWALRRGVDDVVIRMQRHRKAAHLFLGQMGYTVTKEQRVYERDLASPLNENPTKSD
jgi:N-acetylglutamate synthase-like GNAT family acetyltransferase